MGAEIERKFLLIDESWRHAVERSTVYRQGYLSDRDDVTVRIRIAAESAWITVKGPSDGIARAEFEYDIPVADAGVMLSTLCRPPLIEKTRHIVTHAGFTWEIDEFAGDNVGLVVAEVELSDADQQFELPDWAGKDVSSLTRYFNAALVERPFATWTAAEQAGE